MRRTRLSLFYLAGYLLPTGLALLLAPRTTLRLMLSNGHYDSDVFPRVAGLLLLALGIIVVQIIRLRAEALYTATLMARSVLLAGFMVFYWYTRDPFFLVVLGVVALGFALTGTSYWLDRNERRDT
jgi:uncharacterized protein YjeT (DUF2065 family)